MLKILNINEIYMSVNIDKLKYKKLFEVANN